MDAVLLSHLVQAAINVTNADGATMQLLTNGGLQLVASRGFKRDFLEFFDIVRANESACGAALAQRAPVIVDDVRTSEVFVGKPSLLPMLDAGSLSCVSIPIVSRRGALLGMMSPHRRTVGRPAAGELKRLEWLAEQAAALLDGTASLSTVRGLEILARP
jgi:hypothetical protein